MDPTIIQGAPELNPDAIEPSIDPRADDGDDEVDADDLADDAFSAVHDLVGPKLVPNGTYSVALENVSYTELPRAQGNSYFTFNYRISKGPYAGKRIAHREALVR